MSYVSKKPKPLQAVAPIAFSVREASRAFSPPLNPTLIYTAIRLGRLKCHHIGVRNYITDDELRDFIKARPAPRSARKRGPNRKPATEPLTTTEPTGETP